MEHLKFIADVHLGRLARMLRMLGFDTLYENDLTPQDLTRLAMAEGRILLSRSTALSADGRISCLLIAHKEPERQLAQVMQAFALQALTKPFTRCLKCNGLLRPVGKDEVLSLLQPQTIRYFDAFWQCTSCGRVFWQGSHYGRMLRRITDMERIGDRPA